MIKYLGFDYCTSIKIYEFCEKRNEIHIILNNIERNKKQRKEKVEREMIYE